jgi:Xaa-Pro aminopeptidase
LQGGDRFSRSGEDALEHAVLNHFAERRARVYTALESGVLVLPAAPQLYWSRDTEVPYRPDADLYYLTGCSEPESVAVFAPGAEEGPFILFVRSRDPDAERWSGARLGPEEARERFGADVAFPLSELEERLGELLRVPRTVHFRFGAGLRTDELVSSALRYARGRGARTGTGPRTVVDPGAILDGMRLIKDDIEIDAIRTAVSISIRAFRAAISGVRPGLGEKEIQALLDGGFLAGGADGPAFETIVGAGVNACVLHYVANASSIGEGELLLMDAGATKGMYAADITRTVPANGTFTPLQRDVYDIVDAARVAAIGECRSGDPCSGAHEAAVALLAAGLVDLGALTGPADQIIESGSYRSFFPHQTSHWLGVDVHDVGDYAVEGIACPLEPGMVLTVEPGLYFSPEVCSSNVPQELIGMGIRLEDDVLVTSSEPDVLTEALPVSADDIQDLMA